MSVELDKKRSPHATIQSLNVPRRPLHSKRPVRHLKSNTKYKIKRAGPRSNSIDLKKTIARADQCLINPLGGTFGIETLDPLIDEHFRIFSSAS